MRALWSDRPNCSHNVSQKLNVSGAFLILSSKIAENAAIVGKLKKNHMKSSLLLEFPRQGPESPSPRTHFPFAVALTRAGKTTLRSKKIQIFYPKHLLRLFLASKVIFIV